MMSRDFCYWLQGFFELQSPQNQHLALNPAQVEVIRKHLAMVFKHEIDPSLGTPKHVAELQKLHDDLAKANERIDEVESRPSPPRRDTPFTC